MVQYKEAKNQVGHHRDLEEYDLDDNDNQQKRDNDNLDKNDQMLEPTDSLPVTGAETAAGH